MEPFLDVDLGLLLQVRGVRRAGLTLHLRVLGQLQLLEALELWDSTQRKILWKKEMDYESAACIRNCEGNFLPWPQ